MKRDNSRLEAEGRTIRLEGRILRLKGRNTLLEGILRRLVAMDSDILIEAAQGTLGELQEDARELLDV